MLTKLKSWFQELVEEVANVIRKLGLKPNTISTLGLVLGLSSGIAYWIAGYFHAELDAYRVYLILASILLLSSSLCDALDGAMARIYGEVTVFGSFLDSIIDRYVDSAVLVGIMIGGLCDPTWGALALVGSLLTSYVRARAESYGVMMESVGFIERAERIVIILISTLVEIAWPYLHALQIGVIVLAVVSNFTVLQRILYFYKAASGNFFTPKQRPHSTEPNAHGASLFLNAHEGSK